MAYYIGRFYEPQAPSSRLCVKARVGRPTATVCSERFKTREAARIALRRRWPDGAGVVIEAGSRKAALDTLTGRSVAGPLGRLLLMLHLRSAPRIHFAGSSESGSSGDDGGLFGSGSREPRRPAPGGLSASVALRPPDGPLPDGE